MVKYTRRWTADTEREECEEHGRTVYKCVRLLCTYVRMREETYAVAVGREKLQRSLAKSRSRTGKVWQVFLPNMDVV